MAYRFKESEMEITLEQARQLLQMFGGEETTVSLTETDAGLALRAKERKALEKTLSRDPKYKK